ncbi:MAG: PepSY domain-containing protein [Thioalkalivibrio sp.]
MKRLFSNASRGPRLTGPALALLLCLGGVGYVNAAPAMQHSAALQLAQAQVSLNQAVAQVQRRVGGRVLSAETQTHNGVPVHVIRVLTDNQRVRTIRVDGRTGEWMS